MMREKHVYVILYAWNETPTQPLANLLKNFVLSVELILSFEQTETVEKLRIAFQLAEPTRKALESPGICA
jgi:hypothetical protein